MFELWIPMKRRKPARHALFCSGVFSALLMPALNAAETVPSDGLLEPLTVTGSWVASSLDATKVLPDATALSFGSVDLSASLPSLQVAGSGAFSFNDTISLRGFSNTPIFGSAAVALYLEEIALSGPFSLPEDLSLLANAELQYGSAASFRQGRAAPGGALILGLPDFGASSQVLLRAGSHEGIGGGFRVTAGDSASWLMAAATHGERDGYVRNVVTGQDVDAKDSSSLLLRGGLKRGSFELGLTGLYQRARNGAQPMVPLGGDVLTVARSEDGVVSGASSMGGLTLAWQGEALRLESISSFGYWKLDPYVNVMSFGFAELTNDVAMRQNSWAEELRLSSNTPGGLEWHAIGFVAGSKLEGDFTRAFGPMVLESSDYATRKQEWALALSGRQALGSTWSLEAGLRVEGVRTRFARNGHAPVEAGFEDARWDTGLLPRLALSRSWGELRAELAACAGFKPGGYSAFTGNEALAPFGAERSSGLEFALEGPVPGVKSLSGFLRAHAYRISGYQIERSFATGAEADDYLVVNAGRTRSLGAELGLNWAPLSGLRLSAQGSVLRATLRDFEDPYTGTVEEGSPVPFSPDFTLSVRADYRAKCGAFVGVGLQRTGRIHYTEDGADFFSQAPVTLLSAVLGWENRDWALRLEGRNLTDERYYGSISPGTYHGTAAAPLEWGCSVTRRF